MCMYFYVHMCTVLRHTYINPEKTKKDAYSMVSIYRLHIRRRYEKSEKPKNKNKNQTNK